MLLPRLVASRNSLGISGHLFANLIRIDIHLLTFSFQHTTHLAVNEHKIVSFEITF